MVKGKSNKSSLRKFVEDYHKIRYGYLFNKRPSTKRKFKNKMSKTKMFFLVFGFYIIIIGIVLGIVFGIKYKNK